MPNTRKRKIVRKTIVISNHIDMGLKTKPITLAEKINGDKLAYVIYNMEKYVDIIRKKSSQFKGCPLKLATSYLEASKHQEVVVIYNQNKFNGRMMAKFARSFQMISRPVRHITADGLYIDVDIINCHPTILLQLCKNLNIKCPNLEKLVNNREKYINGKHRGKIKNAYIKIINGSKKAYNDCKNICPDPQHMCEFFKEMAIIRNIFVCQFPQLAEQVKNKRISENKTYNHDGGLMSVILNQIEHKILMAMYEFFGKPKDCVLCFDGIMLAKDGEYDLLKCEEAVKMATGYDIKLKIKPFNEGLQLPEDPKEYEGLYQKYMKTAKMKKEQADTLNDFAFIETDDLKPPPKRKQPYIHKFHSDAID